MAITPVDGKFAEGDPKPDENKVSQKLDVQRELSYPAEIMAAFSSAGMKNAEAGAKMETGKLVPRFNKAGFRDPSLEYAPNEAELASTLQRLQGGKGRYNLLHLEDASGDFKPVYVGTNPDGSVFYQTEPPKNYQ